MMSQFLIALTILMEWWCWQTIRRQMMSIASLSDIYSAYDSGRVHVQRFYKAASVAGDTHWIDWAYASGQPGYDARIGVSGQFNPYVASKNDAVYFPEIPAGQERHLAGMVLRTVAGGASQVVLNAIVYDLLGVYPLIDGDSTELQPFTNENPLTRYIDGSGVVPVLVNHIAPMLNAATGTMVYTSQSGVTKTKAIGVNLTGQNKVVSGITGTTSVGAVAFPLADNDSGVLNVQSIQFDLAPGGLFSLYLIRILATIPNHDGMAVTTKVATEKSFLTKNGWLMPRIYNGAHLGMFLRPNGGGRTVASTFGYMEFIWG
jgi:hypothetical protein